MGKGESLGSFVRCDKALKGSLGFLQRRKCLKADFATNGETVNGFTGTNTGTF